MPGLVQAVRKSSGLTWALMTKDERPSENLPLCGCSELFNWLITPHGKLTPTNKRQKSAQMSFMITEKNPRHWFSDLFLISRWESGCHYPNFSCWELAFPPESHWKVRLLPSLFPQIFSTMQARLSNHSLLILCCFQIILVFVFKSVAMSYVSTADTWILFRKNL